MENFRGTEAQRDTDERGRLEQIFLEAVERADIEVFRNTLSPAAQSLFDEYTEDFQLRLAAIALLPQRDMVRLRELYRSRSGEYRPVLHDMAPVLQAYDAVTTWKLTKN